ncbi:hypothetical protein THAOC_14223 [Thalassiosira oceanica]|uniref:B30.2/SPRY domain-containing protein n=1 Tax=Thalassiosira oceanica TaxID=159749 RepID=K0SFQ8_THAOC|nr:hypothetical protein THAOC_14223 [Thalassiosira oceanica]|eukprot:EJK64983.1 hypothetical protein THAOC_14223 [Thalassiosira oceanica]
MTRKRRSRGERTVAMSATGTHGTIERQRVASALANMVDVVSQLATFLEAADLCHLKATCKSLGAANTFNGLSVVDEAAVRIYRGASDEEKAVLPRYEGESWIVLYHHLLMLRARLTFDQLVGRYVEYRGGDKSSVQGISGYFGRSQAICGDHIMRAGKHWATFTRSSSLVINQTVGVIRPLPGWEKRGILSFNPGSDVCCPDLHQERTDRWEGNVHYCCVNMTTGYCHWTAWRDTDSNNLVGHSDYDEDCLTLGVSLDLDEGTLSLYQNGRRLCTLKDGLAGEYCWIAGFFQGGDVSVQRGYNVNRVA